MRNDVLAMRFPRCVDADGGFHQEFDRRWQPLPDSPRSVVYQARMTWVAATVARRRPDLRHQYTVWADHGMRHLQDAFRDGDRGGIRFRPDRDERHSYGVAFAIFAAAARARLDDDASARRVALELFRWWEPAYDRDRGVYAGPLSADASPRRHGDRRRDAIGVPDGQDATNTQVHVVEALTELLRATDDDAVRSRLSETVVALERTVSAHRGRLFTTFDADGRPIDRDVSYGHDLQAVFLGLDARAALGWPSTTPLEALVEPAVRRGVDRRTGAVLEGRRHGRPGVRSHRLEWVQMEAVNAFAVLAALRGAERDRYLRLLSHTWHYVERALTDHEVGGLVVGRDRRGRVIDPRKSHRWFACYHSVRAMLNASDRLAELSQA